MCRRGSVAVADIESNRTSVRLSAAAELELHLVVFGDADLEPHLHGAATSAADPPWT
jgi:hypothetical protein